MVSVTTASRYITSASRYHPRYQSRSSMHIRGLIPRNFAELAEAVPISVIQVKSDSSNKMLVSSVSIVKLLTSPTDHQPNLRGEINVSI